eukprot:527690-Prorocentrum_minimum.AAC.1
MVRGGALTVGSSGASRSAAPAASPPRSFTPDPSVPPPPSRSFASPPSSSDRKRRPPLLRLVPATGIFSLPLCDWLAGPAPSLFAALSPSPDPSPCSPRTRPCG